MDTAHLTSMIHGPSVGIGAGIASVAIILILLAGGGKTILDVPSVAPTTDAQPTLQADRLVTDTHMGWILENSSPTLGDPDAPITLVEFGDYQCHFCSVFFNTTKPDIVKQYINTGKVKMNFKDFNIVGKDSVLASHGAYCAGTQGMFWTYHDVLYSNWAGENTGWASRDNLERLAGDAGLEMGGWNECVVGQYGSSTILASNTDAKKLGLTGTPAFFVIGPDGSIVRIMGAQDYEEFVRIFDGMLE